MSIDVPERADLEQVRGRWRNAVAGVLSKSNRTDSAQLGDHPERLLDTQTADGFAIRALYTAFDELPEPPLPGQWPFVRGGDPLRDVHSGWKVAEAFPANGATADTNAAVLAALGENRSQLVHTMARGRQVVFWQSPKTRKQSRPGVRTPTARAAGIPELHIVVDAHERYPYTFADKPAKTTREALPCGDYGLKVAGQLVAAVERKALADLTSGVLNGNLKYQLTELAALPRAAVVVEDRYSEIFAHSFARPTAIADGLAELQIGFPNVPIVFCQTRKLAQEYTYRYLAAALTWFVDDADATTVFEPAAAEPEPSSAELRAWAKSVGLPVSDRGRLRPQILQAWRAAHPR